MGCVARIDLRRRDTPEVDLGAEVQEALDLGDRATYTMQPKLALNFRACLHLLSDGITAVWRHALLGESFRDRERLEWFEAESNVWREAVGEGREHTPA